MPLKICCAQWPRPDVATSVWSALGPAPTMLSPPSVVYIRPFSHDPTDRPAAESILSRALISSPIHVAILSDP